MIRAALVGVSGYGRFHLLMCMEQALRGRLRLCGATVINPVEQAGVCRRLAALGVPVFPTYEAMMAELNGRVDLVLLPTGIQWHAPMTLAALRAGAHVLVEKPVAATLQDADAVMAAQAVAGRLVAIGFQDLYVPAAHDIKRRVLAGEIGPLRRITVRGQWPRSSSYYARNNWAGRVQLDGTWVLDSPAANAFAHFLMLALFWAGDAPESAAEVAELEGELYRAGSIESFDTACLRLRTTAGVEILFYGTHAGQEDLPPEVRVAGGRGEITWLYERAYTISAAGAAPVEHPVPDQLDTRLTVLEAVLDRLDGRPRFIVEPAMARIHTLLLNALHEHCLIRSIPAAWIDRVPERSGVFLRIRGIDALISQAATRGELFHEAGAPWATPAGRVSGLSAYRKFAGALGNGVDALPARP